MSDMTDYLETMIGNVIFRSQAAWKPAAIWVALYTVAPNDDGTGGTEVSGGNYARVQVPQADAQWNAPAGGNGLFSNVNDIAFPAPNANWGQVVAFAILDNSAGGNMLIKKAVTAPKTVNSGDPAPKFTGGSPGAMTVTFA
jgi:hypothetical protein